MVNNWSKLLQQVVCLDATDDVVTDEAAVEDDVQNEDFDYRGSEIIIIIMYSLKIMKNRTCYNILKKSCCK